MQVIYDNTALFPVAEGGTRAESGSVADPKTGGVRALVGRVGSDQNPGFHVPTTTLPRLARSPGSAIKPLVVYWPSCCYERLVDQ